MIERTHDRWLDFLQRAIAVPIGFSLEEMIWLKRVAQQQYPMLAPVIAAYIEMCKMSEPNVPSAAISSSRHSREPVVDDTDIMSLALLRDTKLFPKNANLIEVARRMLPDLPEVRMDKMSRDEIIQRIRGHLLKIDRKRVFQFSASLKAVMAKTLTDPSEQSFMAKWQAVIQDTKA